MPSSYANLVLSPITTPANGKYPVEDTPQNIQKHCVIWTAMERLTAAVNHAKEVNKEMQEAFAPVVAPRACGKGAPDEKLSAASDLGQALMAIANQLEIEFAQMRDFINASDV